MSDKLTEKELLGELYQIKNEDIRTQLKEIVERAYKTDIAFTIMRSERDDLIREIAELYKQQKPKVSRKWVEMWEDSWARRYNHSGVMIYEIIEMLKEIGVEVEDE